MPATDLTTVHDRLKFGWFKQWMDNPLVAGTRMPQFWVNHEATFKEIAGGTEDGRQAAMWSYLSIGESMFAFPHRIESRRHGTGSGRCADHSPHLHGGRRAAGDPIVGFPESVHIVFDANGVKLAKAWRGNSSMPAACGKAEAGSGWDPLAPT